MKLNLSSLENFEYDGPVSYKKCNFYLLEINVQYMEHGSLYDLLHNETMVIDGELLLPLLRDVSQGVRFLHSADPQVIHGDLKAANILVDSKFRAKVADFGLSQKKHLGGSKFFSGSAMNVSVCSLSLTYVSVCNSKLVLRSGWHRNYYEKKAQILQLLIYIRWG